MATNPPEPQPVTFHGIPEVKVKGIPSLFQSVLWLVGTVLFIVGTILGGERFIISNSLAALEARMNERATKAEYSLKEVISKSVAPLNEELFSTRRVVRRLLSASTLSQAEKNDLGKDLALSTVKTVLRDTAKNAERRSVESLLRDKQIEKREVAKFTWNDGKNEGQIRYFELLNPDLDLSQIDLYSEGDNPCDSRVLDLPGVDAVVQACEAHLESKGRLEFIVIRNSE